jgi:hypothetical protein
MDGKSQKGTRSRSKKSTNPEKAPAAGSKRPAKAKQAASRDKAAKVRRSGVKAELGRKEAFSRGMIQWFQSRKYQVGLQSPQVSIESEVKWAKRITTVAQGLASLAMPMWVSGSVDSADALDALAPFVPLADMVAWRIDGSSNAVVPLIYADEIPAETLLERFTKFLDLAEMGIRMNLQSMASGNVFPLLVYFQRENYEQAVPQLRTQGFLKRFWRRTYLTAGFVDLAGGQVLWAERSGFFALGQAISTTFGVKVDPFDSKDLVTVLTLMQGSVAA